MASEARSLSETRLDPDRAVHLAVCRMVLVSNCPSEGELVDETPCLLTFVELKMWGASSPTGSGYQARGRPRSAGQWSIKRQSFRGWPNRGLL